MQRPDFRIGISGWTYAGWRGIFFPKGLPHNQELSYASRQVNSIEINGSFYGLQRPTSYRRWYDQTPENFIFAVKASRYITHIRRLLEPKKPLANFLASGVLALREKLGPFLWQFPPNFKFDPARVEEFFSLLPRTLCQAAMLARKHDPFMSGRSTMRVNEDHPLRHAMEIRNESFCTPEFVKLLRKYKVAAVFADSAGKWPYFEDLTTDFVYLRLHGVGQMYVGGYDDAAIHSWSDRLRAWTRGKQAKNAVTLVDTYPRAKFRDAYVYFDNDVKVEAPFNAISLLHELTDFRPASPYDARVGKQTNRRQIQAEERMRKAR